MVKMFVAAGVVLVAAACGGGHVEPVPPAFQAALTGLWGLNEELSENLQDMVGGGRGVEGQPGPGGRGGRGGTGGRGGSDGSGSSGRGGAGRGGPGGAPPPGADPAQMQAAMRALRPARRINIELSDSTVVLRLNRQQPLSLRLDGADTEFELGPDAHVKARAVWKDDTLRMRRKFDQITITESYALVSGTDRMEVVVESSLGGRRIKVTRVYDRVGN